MADTKISADPNLASPAAGDLLPIVDISVLDADKNKTLTYSQLAPAAHNHADTAQEYTKTQNFNATILVDGANISWDLSSNQVAKVTLAGNRTLDNPTNMVDGATYILRVIQDATGTRTLSFGTAYKWEGGTAPVVTATANAIDILTFVCDGANMYGAISQDFS